MSARHEILVSPDGQVRFIYSDTLAAVLAPVLGPGVTRRASHVEPAVGDFARPGWTADMAPVGGPVLGPFPSRARALEAETDWLREHNVPVPE